MGNFIAEIEICSFLMKNATRRYNKVITKVYICRQLGQFTCAQARKLTHAGKNSLIVSHSKMKREENSSDGFGKPTSHYCNHPYGVHSIIS